MLCFEPAPEGTGVCFGVGSLRVLQEEGVGGLGEAMLTTVTETTTEKAQHVLSFP